MAGTSLDVEKEDTADANKEDAAKSGFWNLETFIGFYRIPLYVGAWYLTQREPNFFYEYWFGAVAIDRIVEGFANVFVNHDKRAAKRLVVAEKLIASGKVAS